MHRRRATDNRATSLTAPNKPAKGRRTPAEALIRVFRDRRARARVPASRGACTVMRASRGPRRGPMDHPAGRAGKEASPTPATVIAECRAAEVGGCSISRNRRSGGAVVARRFFNRATGCKCSRSRLVGEVTRTGKRPVRSGVCSKSALKWVSSVSQPLMLRGTAPEFSFYSYTSALTIA